MSQVMSVLVERHQELRVLVNMMQTYGRQQPNGQCSRCYVTHLRASDRLARLGIMSGVQHS